jgi:hypothetical protein
MKVGDSSEEGGGELSRQSEGGQDLQGKKMGAQDQIGRVREDRLRQPEKGQAVDRRKNAGEAEGQGVGESVEKIENLGKTAGKEKVEGAVGPAIGENAEVQGVKDLGLDVGGEKRDRLRDGLGGPHVAASDADSQNEELFSVKLRGIAGWSLFDGNLLP